MPAELMFVKFILYRQHIKFARHIIAYFLKLGICLSFHIRNNRIDRFLCHQHKMPNLLL